MIGEYEKVLILKISKTDFEEIEQIVKDGKIPSKSEFVRNAITAALNQEKSVATGGD